MDVETGERISGVLVPVPADAPFVHGVIYEARLTSELWIPDWLQLQAMQAVMKLTDYLKGTETFYVAIDGKNVIVQFTGRSPIAVATVVALITAALYLLMIVIIAWTVHRIITPIEAGSSIIILGLIVLGAYFVTKIEGGD